MGTGEVRRETEQMQRIAKRQGEGRLCSGCNGSLRSHEGADRLPGNAGQCSHACGGKGSLGLGVEGIFQTIPKLAHML